MLPLTAAELPLGILLLLACYFVVQRSLGAEHQPVTVLLGLLLGFAAMGVATLLEVWLGLRLPGGPLTVPEGLGLGLVVAIPTVALNALLILWRATPLDAGHAGSAAGSGFALARLMSFAVSGMQIHLVTLEEVLLGVPFVLLSMLMAYSVSLALALGRDRHRLALAAVLAALLLTLNLTADRVLMLMFGAFVAYEVVAILLAAGIIVLVLRAYREARPSAEPIDALL